MPLQQQVKSRPSRLVAGTGTALLDSSREKMRAAAQLAGLGFAAAGLVVGQPALLVPAAFLLGWSVSRDAERAYMEGFADGTLAASELDAASDGGGYRGGVPGLPDDAGDDEARPAPRPLVRRFGPPSGTEPVGFGVDGRSGPRPPSGPYAPDGSPAARPATISTGIPAAELTGTAGLERFAARAAARGKAGARVIPGTGEEG